MEANKFVLVHQNSIGASFGLNALSGKKEKEKEASRRTFFQSPHYLFSAFDRHWGSRNWHICKKSD